MRIIGISIGGDPQGPVRVVVDNPGFWAWAYPDGRIELEQGSHFSKADFWGHDPRRFMQIIGGRNPEEQELKKFIAITEAMTISKADAENLFKWNLEGWQ